MSDDLIRHAKTGAIGRKLRVVDEHAVDQDADSITVTLAISPGTMMRAIEIGNRRRQDPTDMMVDILTYAIDDDMVDAIIDDGSGK